MTVSMVAKILKNNLSELKAVNGLPMEVTEKIFALKKNPVVGKYDFANDIYINVESYTTVPFDSKEYEAHKKYVDIQVVLKGREDIYVADVKDRAFRVTKPYVYDIEFMDGNVSERVISLNEGEFCVLLPEDAHKPCIMQKSQSNVETVIKAVVKLPLELYKK